MLYCALCPPTLVMKLPMWVLFPYWILRDAGMLYIVWIYVFPQSLCVSLSRVVSLVVVVEILRDVMYFRLLGICL